MEGLILAGVRGFVVGILCSQAGIPWWGAAIASTVNELTIIMGRQL